jgi:hypothetical protein
MMDKTNNMPAPLDDRGETDDLRRAMVGKMKQRIIEAEAALRRPDLEQRLSALEATVAAMQPDPLPPPPTETVEDIEGRVFRTWLDSDMTFGEALRQAVQAGIEYQRKNDTHVVELTKVLRLALSGQTGWGPKAVELLGKVKP